MTTSDNGSDTGPDKGPDAGTDNGSISDDQLPEDVRPGEDNPLANNPDLKPDGSTDQTGDRSAPENPLDPPDAADPEEDEPPA